MRFWSLFTGIGGFDEAFRRAGMECVLRAEIDGECRSVMERHHPGVQTLDDVLKLRTYLEPRNAGRHTAEFVRPDIICGGFPCQDLSVAGKRAGLAGERSGLWYVFRRVIALVRPSGFCIENVPGLLSSNDGRDMGILLGALGKLGYGYAYRVLDSQWFGLAQRRKRVFIVGCLGDPARACEILFERRSLPWDSPPSRKKKPGVAGTIDAGAGVRRGAGINPGTITECLNSGGNSGGFRSEPGAHLIHCPTVSPAIKARDFKGPSSDGDGDGDGDGAPCIAFDTTQVTSPGNYSQPKQGDPCHPLAAGAHAPAVAYQCHGSNVGQMGALRVGNGNETGGVPFVFEPRIGRNGRGQPSELVNTLKGSETGDTSDMRPCVAYRTSGNSGVMEQGDKTAALNCGTDPNQTIVQLSSMAVRRLTPRECERLQGFPDDWTRWGHDGREISDSARYRMLGNAVSIPPAEWIGRRIMECG